MGEGRSRNLKPWNRARKSSAPGQSHGLGVHVDAFIEDIHSAKKQARVASPVMHTLADDSPD